VLPASQFREVVALQLASAHHDARPLACAFLEVTGFRRVSERHGPAMALAMLGVLGRCMRRCLRRADTVGRLGAERFLVLLPETAAVEATALIEQLRAEFEAATRSCPDGVSLRVVMLSYERSPATLDDLVRDIKALVSASRSSGAAGSRSAMR
jgi:diguanylate cyclase (GGDEF)-like protein